MSAWQCSKDEEAGLLGARGKMMGCGPAPEAGAQVGWFEEGMGWSCWSWPALPGGGRPDVLALLGTAKMSCAWEHGEVRGAWKW